MSNNNNNKPLIMLDVDGVVNAFDAGIVELDEWMTEQMGKPWGKRGTPEGYRVASAAGYRITYADDIADRVAVLEGVGEMVWSTMWLGKAATELAPVVGFGSEWGYIDFHAHHDAGTAWGMRGMGVGSYKAPGIDAIAGNRPVVVIDDDLGPDNYDWAYRRVRRGIPTLMVQPSTHEGLTWEHIDEIRAFSERVAALPTEYAAAATPILN